MFERRLRHPVSGERHHFSHLIDKSVDEIELMVTAGPN
jgi:hypothetical protein